jgi:hypothetical protein
MTKVSGTYCTISLITPLHSVGYKRRFFKKLSFKIRFFVLQYFRRLPVAGKPHALQITAIYLYYNPPKNFFDFIKLSIS